MTYTQCLRSFAFIGLAAFFSMSFAQEEAPESSTQGSPNQESAAEKKPPSSEEDNLVEWQCDVKWYCYEDGVVHDSDWEPGFGADGPAACADAESIIYRDIECDESTLYVCNSNPTSPPCEAGDVPAPEEVPTIVHEFRRGDSVIRVRGFKNERYISRITAVNDQGNEVGAGSRLMPTPEEATASAWEEFKPRLTDHVIVPGSLKVRTVRAFFYRCFARVQSRHENTIIDQEVEANGNTPESALERASLVADGLAESLRRSGHRRVRVYVSRCERIKNSLRNTCQETVLCRHQCTTSDGEWTIITARRARDRSLACTAAEAAAAVIADPFGGIDPSSCFNAPPITSAASRTQGCAGCGDSQSKENAASP